ncbi:MAG TPA: FMN-binding negative transcriptional regulator [Acidiferrobacterales bacterium]|nr:FMN-binding negative transcriptional regulator [Acidiferrobacterales bacterium]
MYVPSYFEETRVEVLHQLIREHSLAVLVTLGSEGLNANHIPFEIDPEPAPFGTLRGHVARANPVWRDSSKEVEPLVIFQGPQAYITPSWYQTKKETGKVVPTYNYVVVHAYGPLRVVEDRAWLRGLVERLTNRYEAARPVPWKVTDAPGDFIEKMLGAIVGMEIPITKLVGKWKVSQNRPSADRDGVVKGLREINSADAVAMADLVKESINS